MIQTGIIGGAGYTAGELIRLLIHHPEVEIAFVQSKSQAGRAIVDIHQDLVGEIDMTFTAAHHVGVDVLFFCQGHGNVAPFLADNEVPSHVKIVDLSRDFRLAGAHEFIYGLPELHRARIQEANRIANPGCFATCIQLGLLPLAASQRLDTRIPVQITAITGATGAGQKPQPTTHFSWRQNNLSVYKVFTHQHLPEIKQSLAFLSNTDLPSLNFIPMRGGFPRGIFASMYVDFQGDVAEIKQAYQHFYQNAPFTHVVDTNPHLKQVVNTNKAMVYVEEIEGKLLIISMIDNLLKGASGQAVQNMNLMMGLPEEMGLRLKALAF
ncbi:MAG: N-acetyl-gamma-glutamyl-phosphate reductase [Bacteroidota bacterium]